MDQVPGVTSQRHLVDAAAEADIPAIDTVLIDTAVFAPTLQRYVREQSNLSDFTEQSDSYTLDPGELEAVRYVAGRSYDAVEVYEFETGLSPRWSVSPYFRVSREGQQYGSEHLGLGELAGLLLYWAVSRLDPGTIVLIDEPESFLAAHSQVAVADVIAFAVSEHDVACVLTSHSDNVVSRIPASRRLICMLGGGGLSILTAEEAPNHLSVIGLGGGTRLVAVVEDAAATAFLRELIALGAPALRGSIEVCFAGSAGEVVSALNKLPESFSHLSLKFVGVLDGDQKAEDHKCFRPLLYLPIEADPEEVARSAAVRHPEKLASALGIRVTTVQAAVAKHEGLNHHDWPFAVGSELGRSHHEILAICLRSFISHDLSPEMHQRFLEQLTSREVMAG